jgi:hypothetical protein
MWTSLYFFLINWENLGINTGRQWKIGKTGKSGMPGIKKLENREKPELKNGKLNWKIIENSSRGECSP